MFIGHTVSILFEAIYKFRLIRNINNIRSIKLQMTHHIRYF